ncbi:MAG: FtsX-like permease family protein [Candidatus Latescibacteria bacterium]|nr:FtsX-like permease family protein [Candidatus Latescibacterota bacterium]
MLLLIRLAWRNLFRNGRRTVLAGLAIGIGLASLIFSDALIAGMETSMIHSATHTFLGQGQIHAAGFTTSLAAETTIAHPRRTLDQLRTDPSVAAATPRLQGFAMLASPANTEGIVLYGIDPATERGISALDEAIVEGQYLDTAQTPQLLIGQRLAHHLEVELGDRLVATVAQAHSGELAQELFRVGGLFRFGVRELDGQAAFVRLEAGQRLFGLEGQLHEIAFHLHPWQTPPDFWQRHSQNGNLAQSWQELLPDLEAALDMSRFSMLVIAVILFCVVALSIINTLFMSLYERLFEFGVLRAVGTRPWRLAALVLWEALCLSLVSIAMGAALGWGSVAFAAYQGIDYTGLEYSGVTIRQIIYPQLHLRQFIIYPLFIVFSCLVAGLYPALHAARLSPATAMRTAH